MKKYFILVSLVTAFSLNSFCQNICNKNLSQADFTIKLKSLSNSLSGKIKLQRTTEIVKNYCITSSQAVGFSKLFKNDSIRLVFIESAYPNISDKQNFYAVFDTFSHFSEAFKLYDFLQQKKSGSNMSDKFFAMPEFPKFTYPESSKYEGYSPCKFPMSEDDFKSIVHQTILQEDASARLAIATNASLKKCLSTAQAMKIASLFKSDEDKLTYLEALWNHIFDQKNYGAASQVFFYHKQQKEFANWLQDKLGKTENTDKNCTLTAVEYDTIKTKIGKINFITEKQSTAEKLIKENKCFTSAQIKDIVALFNFDKNKLSIAQYAYNYCTDKENYYLVGDAFTFSAGKNKLINFINGQKGK